MSLTLHTNLRAVLLAACTLTLAACPEGGKETESGTVTEATTDAGTESASSTDTTGNTPTSGTPTEGTMTGAMSDSTTTDDASTETASTSETMGGVTTTTVSTTEGTTAVDTDTDTEGDTGVVPPELQGACVAACDKFYECIPMPPFPDEATCAAECAGSLGEGEGCLEATVAFNLCVGEFTCDELDTALADEEFGPCADEFETMNTSCVASLCEGFGSSNGADDCSIGQMCEGSPTEEFHCEGDTCTCLVDDVADSECDAPANFCELDFADQAAAAFDCCGFEL